MAPKDASEWTLDGVSIVVDKERVIERGLTADLDDDGSKEAVAWTRARAEAPELATTGELVVVTGAAPAGRVVGKMPAFVPAGPGCRHVVALSQTGPHTVVLDVAARCDAALLQRSPTRGLSVLAPLRDHPSVLELRIADPAPGELLSLSVDSKDRDGDGRDDVRLTASLRAGEHEPDAAADLVWLDRASGPSRDATEPAHSLSSLASLEAARAPGKTTSRQVPARVAAARRLYATLCAESGTPRLLDGDGAPLRCSGIAQALAALLSAEVRALIARRDPAAAAAALGRNGWYDGRLPDKQRALLEKELLAAFPRREATEATLDFAPRARSGLPRWSPLAFEPDGALLGETQDGVVRTRLPSLHAESVSDSVDPWPLTVGAGPAPRWTGIAFPCDRSEVMLLLSDPTGAPIPSRPTPLLSPRPGACGHGAALPTPSLAPLEWTEARAAGLIGGALFGASELAEPGSTPTRGSPRSPDGKSAIIPTGLGLVIVGGAKPEIWSVTDPASLSDCVVASGAAAAACVRADRAVLIMPAAVRR